MGAAGYDDRRAGARARKLKDGTIVFNNGASLVSCIVRDLSITGARLKVEGAMAVPDHFLLLMGSGDSRRE